MTMHAPQGNPTLGADAGAVATGTALAPYDPAKFQRDQARVARGFWTKLRRVAGKLPFLDLLISVYYCGLDPATPLRAKATIMGALAYFILPTDLIPDFFTGIGFIDDATVLYAAARTVADHIKPAHRERAKALIQRKLADAPVDQAPSA
ncbi:MAG TPA: YkvA family protein [Hypericibacter adhaerens]|jgi:uncharacterized membrane protein YkvA (DUF1232 family)|nr:YkvA family protein [Hypericibacter adhaerens]HWA43768.1 YkvA family protein [Hypericibacter adhaerens]